MDCKKGLLSKIKPYGFSLFVKRYGEEELLNCLERNEKKGIVYHRDGINGDYDAFDDVEALIRFIKDGKRLIHTKLSPMVREIEMHMIKI